MNHLKSIRVRLPLLFAGIALLAAVLSGAMLIAILQGYYNQQERQYLQANAGQISQVAAQLIESGAPDNILRDQAVSWSFFVQARLKLLDVQGKVLADSGDRETVQAWFLTELHNSSGTLGQGVATVVEPGTFEQALGPVEVAVGTLSEAPVGTSILLTDGQIPAGAVAVGGQGPNALVISGQARSAVPFTRSIFGFNLGEELQAEMAISSQKVEQAVVGANGDRLGTIVISEGPAYGSEIIRSIWGGWIIASLIAVSLAALAGWIISRRLTRPLVALTAVTRQMAGGDLEARAEQSSGDEFGELGHSFNEMADRIREMVTALRSFVSDAAHELNTPLTALQADLELAASETAPEKQNELLARARRQAGRIQELAAGLLLLSRLEAGGIQQSEEPINLNSLMIGISELAASRMEQGGIEFSADLPPELIWTHGNPGQLTQALDNLLDNARKFTPSGGRVQLSLRKETETITIRIEDNGIGIPEEDLPHLFQRFHRGRNASAYPGSGLGLAIAQAVVEQHDGSITVEKLDQGTAFEVKLRS